MRRRNNKQNNRGFSLIELIVSLAIVSIVVLAIGTLLSIGTKSYYSSNTETELQKESQIAMNQINDLMIKATAYEYLMITTVSGVTIPTLVVTAVEEGDLGTAELYYYAVIVDKDRTQLLFRKQSKATVEADFPTDSMMSWLNDRVNDEMISPTPSLLAKYINKLEINPESSTTNTQGIAQITLELSLGGKTYSTFSSTSFRNK